MFGASAPIDVDATQDAFWAQVTAPAKSTAKLLPAAAQSTAAKAST
jgi:hypothetical protein